MSSPPKKKQVSLVSIRRTFWTIIWPRRRLILVGLVLVGINRLCGLVLPASTKYLIDNVIGKHEMELLTYLVLGVLGATLLQGVTSFALTQLLSKAGQSLIAELRQKVQRHIGLLPVSYYDANKSGVLVSRTSPGSAEFRSVSQRSSRVTPSPMLRAKSVTAVGPPIVWRIRLAAQLSLT